MLISSGRFSWLLKFDSNSFKRGIHERIYSHQWKPNSKAGKKDDRKNHELHDKVAALLSKGFSVRQVARIAGYALSTVQIISMNDCKGYYWDENY